MKPYLNEKKIHGYIVEWLKKPNAMIILLFLLFSNPLSAGSVDSTVIQSNQDAVIHVYSGASMYGTEEVNKAKIIHIPNSSENRIAGIESKKPQNTKAKKLVKILLKKAIVSKKVKSDKKIYDPLSTNSPNTLSVLKKLNPSVSSNNLQDFPKFQNHTIYSLVRDKKYLCQNTIFSYSQKRNPIGFYKIYTVRPPPFF
ncbi:hypothetical protein [Chryseobacterium sp.]|uniref:hypothetical protein n=1 Tax=Chryseobacterium sp. TaxID=1871047 RepID=UPI002FC9ACB0